MRDARGTRIGLVDVVVAAIPEVAQLVHEVKQAGVISRLKDAFKRLARLLGRNDRHHRLRMNGPDRYLDGLVRRLVVALPLVRRKFSRDGAPGRWEIRNDGRPQRLLTELYTIVHSRQHVFNVHLREAGAEITAMLRHDDESRDRRRDADAVQG